MISQPLSTGLQVYASNESPYGLATTTAAMMRGYLMRLKGISISQEKDHPFIRKNSRVDITMDSIPVQTMSAIQKITKSTEI